MQVVEKLRSGFHAGDEQMVSGAGAGDIEQVAFGVVDFLEVCIIADRSNPLLKRQDFLVAGHHGHAAEFETFGEVHGADRDMAVGGFDMVVQNI